MGPPRLKIAQVATSDISIRFLLLNHIKALMQQGYEVTAVCAPGDWVESVRSQGIQVETVDMAREVSSLRDARSLHSLTRCFRSHGFDVVHTHTPKVGILGPLAARLARTPVIVHTIHGLLFHDAMPAWHRNAYWLPEKITALLCHRLLSQSQEDIGVAVRTKLCQAGKISFLGNGIDTGDFLRLPEDARARARSEAGFKEDDFIVGSVGRLVYEKGFAEFFAAAEQLHAKHPKMKFMVIGPRETQQKDAIAQSVIEERSENHAVQFLGYQSDMAKMYSMMDVFALPSHREGIPRACMEAMCAGVPVVASNIRGCREVVRDGETGILVPLRNAQTLAQALEALFLDRERTKRMGQTAREHALLNFDERVVLRRLCDFYAAVERQLQNGVRT